MSVGNVLNQSIWSGLIVASLLLTHAQANSGTNSKASPQPDAQTDLIQSVDVIPEHRQCGAHSTLFQKLGESYYDFADHPDAIASSARQIGENKLLSRLMDAPFSTGWGHRVDCWGSGDRLKTKASTVSLTDIQARFWRDSDPESGLFITLHEYDRPARRLSLESVTIPTLPGEVLHLKPENIVSGTRHRTATETGSFLRETLVNAFFAGTTVVIDQSVYVNGTLAQWNTWHLED